MYKSFLHSGITIYARARGIPPAIDKIFISCVLSGHVRISPFLSLSPSSYLSFYLSLCLRLRNRARMTEQSNRLLNKRCRPTCRAALFVVFLFSRLLRDAEPSEKYTTSDNMCIRWTSITSAWWNLSDLHSAFRLTPVFTFNFDCVIVFTFALERRFFIFSHIRPQRATPLVD